MNRITIKAPRWHDRVVLVADHKLAEYNEVVIEYKGQYPHPFLLSARRAREFPLEQMPTRSGGTIGVRAIPIDELEKETI